MKILICGDRNWKDRDLILNWLGFYKRQGYTSVVHGAARGADSLGGWAAKQLDMPVEEFPAQWKVYGKAAGPIRNREMFYESKPQLVLVFHDDLENSKGTKDMVDVAIRAKMPIMHVKHVEVYPL